MKFLIASNNKHKVDEIRSKFNDMNIEILTPDDISLFNFEVEETEITLQGNAFLKAKAFFDKTGISSFSDDTGLFVEELKGRPGVYSARYAGDHCNYIDNCNKLLRELENRGNRKAYFETVICFYDGDEGSFISGRCDGQITKEMLGSNGFGYDPIFLPSGYDKTFAELHIDIKNKISHRGRAVDNFINFIKIKYNL